jgi:hypothetical protein
VHSSRGHLNIFSVSDQSAKETFRDGATANVTRTNKEDAFHDARRASVRGNNLGSNKSKSTEGLGGSEGDFTGEPPVLRGDFTGESPVLRRKLPRAGDNSKLPSRSPCSLLGECCRTYRSEPSTAIMIDAGCRMITLI